MLARTDAIYDVWVDDELSATIGLTWTQMVPRIAYLWFVPRGLKLEHARHIRTLIERELRWTTYAQVVGGTVAERFAAFMGFRREGDLWRRG